MIHKIWEEGGHNLSWLSDRGVWRGTSLEAVSDNHSPDPMYVRQWDHLNFKDVGGTWHGQLTRAVMGFSWA